MNGMSPAYWLILGVVLIVVEVAAPGMVSIFFGLAALVVALLTWVVPMAPWLQWMLFAALAILLLVLLRKWLKGIFTGRSSQAKSVDVDIVGQRAVVTQRIEANRPGKVELRGANWNAEASVTLEPGTPVKVVKQESIVLTVERL